MKNYPYFLYPVINELKFCTDPERAQELKSFIASNVGDFDTLIALIGNLQEDLRTFYPDHKESALNADDSIDSFLAKFSSGSQGFTPSPVLAEIDARGAQENPPSRTEADSSESDEDALHVDARQDQSEDLDNQEKLMNKVSLLVKNGDYNEALEIMESFYLNNPKKSIYFADQIRLVKKLISEESKKK